MTAASRPSDSLAPSLFPFLAVLLCTMGALVLILVLMVAGAESSGKEAVKQVEEDLQWEQEKIQLIKKDLLEKYEEAKIELEKKRLVLQNYEQHIHELAQELEQLEKTAQQTEEKVDTAKDTQQSRDQRLEALEKQLAEAKKEFENKLADPKGDKPIFAIIPYDGPNGTHRRPIYLECNNKGVVVQPEGVVLNPIDLRPPYGPGNPLDAVLRTIRAEFPATNGAVTSNPYPLLVVRPSGIRHFMMARAAMSGWDDQFGYELISEELELTFPPSVPKLELKIVSAIELARERQAALVMAMPKHYSSNHLDSWGAQGGAADLSGGFGEEDIALGNSTAGSGGDGSEPGKPLASNGRGGFSMAAGQSPGGAGRDKLASENSADRLPPRSDNRSGAMSFLGSGGSADGPLATGGAAFRNRFSGNALEAGSDLSMSEGSSGFTEEGIGGAGSSQTSDLFNVASSADSSATANSPDSSSAAGASGGSATGGPSAGGSSFATAGQGLYSSSGTGGSGSAMSSGAQSGNAASVTGATNASADASADPSQAGGITSLNMNLSKNSSETAKPIAQTRGRDWAWRDGNRSQTAIIRAIRLQCYADRWVLLPDRGSKATPTIINLDGTLAQRAEKLAEAVTHRVDGWGVAVAGGHWAPVLHVEVASNAEARFQQLQRFMEGSGIDVVRKATIAPQTR